MRTNIKHERRSTKGSGDGASREEAPESRALKLANKLAELLRKIPGSMEKEEVHKLRTTVRRMEVVLQSIAGGRGRAKLDAQLKSLRKRAGKVRDLDVHLGMLEELESSEARSCEELHGYLANKRNKQAKKLEKIVQSESDDGLEKRLKRAAEAVHAIATDPARAEQQLAAVRERFLSRTAEIPEDGPALHQLRIEFKRLRYEVEALAPDEDARAANVIEAAAEKLVSQLKRVQDEIGVWHDWLTLCEAAQKHLHGPEAAAFLALLRTRTAHHYHNSRRTVAEVRSRLDNAHAPKKVPKSAGRVIRNHSLAG